MGNSSVGSTNLPSKNSSVKFEVLFKENPPPPKKKRKFPRKWLNGIKHLKSLLLQMHGTVFWIITYCKWGKFSIWWGWWTWTILVLLLCGFSGEQEELCRREYILSPIKSVPHSGGTFTPDGNCISMNPSKLNIFLALLRSLFSTEQQTKIQREKKKKIPWPWMKV